MVEVIFSPDANKVYRDLKASTRKIEKSIYNSITEKIKLIKQDPKIGEPVKKKLIPKQYIEKYDVPNLFKVRLANYWRLLYTINEKQELEIIIFIVDAIDHDTYNDVFGFKKK